MKARSGAGARGQSGASQPNQRQNVGPRVLLRIFFFFLCRFIFPSPDVDLKGKLVCGGPNVWGDFSKAGGEGAAGGAKNPPKGGFTRNEVFPGFGE